jgi:hypothetical protein
MKRFAKMLLKAASISVLSCCVSFLCVKYAIPSDKQVSKTEGNEESQAQKQLKRHGNIDRLVNAEYVFLEKQKQKNSDFFKDNIKHLENIADRLRDVIVREKDICKSLTYEYGFVKEQLLLMQDASTTPVAYMMAKENYEKLLCVINKITKITEQEQEALLMWQNIKHLREEQLKFSNNVLMQYAKNKPQKQITVCKKTDKHE